MHRITEDRRYRVHGVPGRVEIFRPDAGDVFLVELKDMAMGQVWIGKKLCSMALARLQGHGTDAICYVLFSPGMWCRILTSVSQQGAWDKDLICLKMKWGRPARGGTDKEGGWSRSMEFGFEEPEDELVQTFLGATRDFVRQRVVAAKVAQALREAARV